MKYKKGFTLVEILAVLAILALVVGLMLPLLKRPSDGLRLERDARKWVNALRLSRSAALASNKDVVLSIDMDTHSFQSSAVPLTSFDPNIQVDMTIAAPERQSATKGAIRFFPDGMTTGGDIILTLQGRHVKISVNWLTGEASVYDLK